MRAAMRAEQSLPITIDDDDDDDRDLYRARGRSRTFRTESTQRLPAKSMPPSSKLGKRRNAGDLHDTFREIKNTEDPRQAHKKPRVERFIDLTNLDDEEEFESRNLEEQEVISIDDYEAELEMLAARSISPPTPIGRQSRFPIRNPPIAAPFEYVDTHRWNNSTLKAGKTVELKDGNFLFIKSLVKHRQSNIVKIRGWKLIRTNQEPVRGMLEPKLNEVCFIHEIDLDDTRPMLEQSVDEVSVNEVQKIRQLHKTNQARKSPKQDPLRYQEFKSQALGINEVGSMRSWVKDNDVLVCRWIYIREYDNAAKRFKDNSAGKTSVTWRRKTIRRLVENECSPSLFEPPQAQRFEWRGPTNLGGSAKSMDADLEEIHFEAFYRRLGDDLRYSFMDTFCGAGGASAGAAQAGLVPTRAFDSEEHCAVTYRANFPGAKLHHMKVDEFCQLPSSPRFLNDVMHLSTPCQFWSPNKKHATANDTANHDTIFCVDKLLNIVKPRMVSIEQTFGFAFSKFSDPFNAFIKQFTDNGYSITWQIFELQYYGLSQARRRLFMIAAGFGETLPIFPAYTHSTNPRDGLKPLVTVNNLLSRIPRNSPNHNIRGTQGKTYPEWNGNDILRSTICTAGVTRSQCVDGKKNTTLGVPNGSRRLTHREIATLQGFPHHHVFKDERKTVIYKMIGNAYPSSVAKVFFGCVREQLEKTDLEEIRQSRRQSQQRVQEFDEAWEL